MWQTVSLNPDSPIISPLGGVSDARLWQVDSAKRLGRVNITFRRSPGQPGISELYVSLLLLTQVDMARRNHKITIIVSYLWGR